MELPAHFVIPYRPVLPINVFAIITGRLITVMYKENMLQGIFSLLLLGKTDSNVFQVEERIDYTCTLVVIFQKFLRSSFKHVLIISS